MKINVTNILLSLLIVILLLNHFSTVKSDSVKPKKVVVHESKGDVEKVIEKVVIQHVYIPSKDKEIIVDEDLLKKYNDAVKSNDSMTQKLLYLESIRVKDYDSIFVDNDTINIFGNIKVRGSLLGYKFNYRIKEKEFEYIPKTVRKYPKMSMQLRISGGYNLNMPFITRGDIEFVNDKGNGLSFGYDTDKRIWLGISKTFKLW